MSTRVDGSVTLGLSAVLGRDDAVTMTLPMPEVTVETKKLVEVADLDNVLGYKGNYMIFPLKENNYITLHMMQDYLEVGDELLLRDPDEFGNYSVEELQELADVRATHADPEVRGASRRIQADADRAADVADARTTTSSSCRPIRCTSSAWSARTRCSRTSSSSTARST